MRFYLRERGGIWYICWTERGIPRRVSTRLRDRGQAELALARHVLIHANPRHQPAEVVTVQSVVLRYWQHHGRQIASRDSVTAALKAVNTYLERVTVAEFGLKRQEAFVRALRSDGLSPGTVKRWVGVVGTALRWAHARQEITDIPPMIRVKAADGDGVRPLSVAELRDLCAACLHDHQRIFVLLAIGTAARPGALVDLTWDRVDFQTGTIAQAVPGVDHGNKRRPRVPMPASVKTYLEDKKSVGPVIQWNGRALTDHKRLYAGLAERAGVEVTAYGIRKACATWMRREGVPEWDVLGMLGHRAGGSQTERYAHWRPEFMRAASESLERLIRAVNPPWLASPLPAIPAGFVQVLDGTGGRTWDRTTDPYHVKDGAQPIILPLTAANDD
jgi:integrase